MFELDQEVKLISVNARAEIHGEERKPAFDLKFEAQCPSSALIAFHPNLRSMLYKAPDNPDLAEQGGDDAETECRFPQIKSIKFDHECEGYHLTIDYGMGGKSAVKLGECTVDKFTFTPQNGGTVLISFRVIAHPEVKDVGKICELIQQDVGIVLRAPEPTTVEELFEKPEEKVAA